MKFAWLNSNIWNHIPVKSKVIVNAWGIGRDPNYSLLTIKELILSTFHLVLEEENALAALVVL